MHIPKWLARITKPPEKIASRGYPSIPAAKDRADLRQFIEELRRTEAASECDTPSTKHRDSLAGGESGEIQR